MKLYKDGMEKDLRSEKAINRWISFGWLPEGEKPEIVDEVKEAPKRRGRPPKEVTNGND